MGKIDGKISRKGDKELNM